MKLKAAVLGAAIMLLAMGAASAGTFRFGPMGGGTFPTGDFSDVAATGWNGGATGTYSVNDQWGLGADVVYHAWSGSDDANAAAEFLYGPGSEVKFSAIQATAHAAWMMPVQGNVKPFAKFGVGLYNLGSKLTSPSGDSDDSQSKVGFNFGAGFNMLSSSNMSWGVSGAYHIVPAQDDFGVDVNMFTVSANLMWSMASQ